MASTENGSTIQSNGKTEASLTGPSFLQLGEVRTASDQDYDYFINLADNHEGWIKKVEKNGLVIWQKECENSSIKMAKVYGEFENVKASTAFDVLLDGKYRRCWDDSVIDDHDLCKLDDWNDIGYYSMKWPTPLKNRDFVNQRSWRCFGEDKFIVFNHSISHPDLPPKKNFIRAISYITGFVIRSTETGCSLTYLTQSDPRGSIPKWIINFALNKLGPAVFKQLHAAASQYEDWKTKNEPDNKPWRNPDQNKLPMADPSLFHKGSDPSLIPVAGKNGDQEEEAPTEECLEEFVEHIAEHLEIKTDKEQSACA